MSHIWNQRPTAHGHTTRLRQSGFRRIYSDIDENDAGKLPTVKLNHRNPLTLSMGSVYRSTCINLTLNVGGGNASLGLYEAKP